MYYKTYIFIYVFFILLPYLSVAGSWNQYVQWDGSVIHTSQQGNGYYRKVATPDVRPQPTLYVVYSPTAYFYGYGKQEASPYYRFNPTPGAYNTVTNFQWLHSKDYEATMKETVKPDAAMSYPIYFDY